MKKKSVLAATIFLIICSCSTNKLISYDDDIYSNPIEEKKLALIAKANQDKQIAQDYKEKASQIQSQKEKDSKNKYYQDPTYHHDDYYDYQYSSRIYRFNQPILGASYYDPYYTNSYSYNQDPLFYGNSIYNSYNYGYSSVINNNNFGFGNNGSYFGCSTLSGFNSFGYSNGYFNNYNSYNPGYTNNGWGYYNSFDPNSTQKNMDYGKRNESFNFNSENKQISEGSKIRETYIEKTNQQRNGSHRFSESPRNQQEKFRNEEFSSQNSVKSTESRQENSNRFIQNNNNKSQNSENIRENSGRLNEVNQENNSRSSNKSRFESSEINSNNNFGGNRSFESNSPKSSEFGGSRNRPR